MYTLFDSLNATWNHPVIPSLQTWLPVSDPLSSPPRCLSLPIPIICNRAHVWKCHAFTLGLKCRWTTCFWWTPTIPSRGESVWAMASWRFVVGSLCVYALIICVFIYSPCHWLSYSLAYLLTHSLACSHTHLHVHELVHKFALYLCPQRWCGYELVLYPSLPRTCSGITVVKPSRFCRWRKTTLLDT